MHKEEKRWFWEQASILGIGIAIGLPIAFYASQKLTKTQNNRIDVQRDHIDTLKQSHEAIVIKYVKDMKGHFKIHSPSWLYPDDVEICAFDRNVCLDGFYERSEAEIKVYNLNKAIRGEKQ